MKSSKRELNITLSIASLILKFNNQIVNSVKRCLLTITLNKLAAENTKKKLSPSLLKVVYPQKESKIHEFFVILALFRYFRGARGWQDSVYDGNNKQN